VTSSRETGSVDDELKTPTLKNLEFVDEYMESLSPASSSVEDASVEDTEGEKKSRNTSLVFDHRVFVLFYRYMCSSAHIDCTSATTR